MANSVAERWQEILSATMKDLSEFTLANVNCGNFCCGCGLQKYCLEGKWISTIIPGDYFLCDQCYQDENFGAWHKHYIEVKCIFNCKGERTSASTNDLFVAKVGWHVAQNSYLTLHCCNSHTEEERDQVLEKYQRDWVENNIGGVDEILWVRFHDFKSHLRKLPANVPLMMTDHQCPWILLDLEVADYLNAVKLPTELILSWEIETLVKRWYSYKAVEPIKQIEEKIFEEDNEDNEDENDDEERGDGNKETGVRNYWNWITNIDGQSFRSGEEKEWATLIAPSFGSLRAWIPFESFTIPIDSLVVGRKITPQAHLYGSSDIKDDDTIKFELFTFVYCDSKSPLFGQVAAGIFSSDTRVELFDAYPDDCALIVHRMNLNIGEYLSKKTALANILLPSQTSHASTSTAESELNLFNSSGLLSILPSALTKITIGYCHSQNNSELLCEFWNKLAANNAVRVCSLK